MRYKNIVYSPSPLSLSELPIVYSFALDIDGERVQSILLSHNGYVLGALTCAREVFMASNLAAAELKALHESVKEIHPAGYQIEFVPPDEVESHILLARARALMLTPATYLGEQCGQHELGDMYP